MPYYWTNVWNIYVNSSLKSIKPNKVIEDLTWSFIAQEEKLKSLLQECEDGNYRKPHTDENCQFKEWFEDISKTHFNFCGDGDNIMKILLEGRTSISESNACSMLHLAPCSIIKKFIVNMTEFYLENDNDEINILDDYEEVRDGRLSPFSIAQCNFGLSNRPRTSDEESDSDYDSMPELEVEEEEDYDDMPELISSEEDYDSEYETQDDSSEEEELRTNQWRVIRFPWQHNITPREYKEEMEGCDCGWCKASRRSELAYDLFIYEYGNNPHQCRPDEIDGLAGCGGRL
jgi:hypothetical protein